MNGSSLLLLDFDEKLKQGEQDSIILNSMLTSSKTKIEIPTKSYVDSLHESSRNRGDLPTVFSDHENEFDNNKLFDLDSISVNRAPSSDNEFSNENFFVDQLYKYTFL